MERLRGVVGDDVTVPSWNYVVSNDGAADTTDNGSILTYTGKLVSVFDPDPSKIDIRDIAAALSKLCRFGGHTRSFYSVAEHSVWCSYRCSSDLALYGLLHDASEAYMVDIPRPIKIHPNFSMYRPIEDGLTQAIATRFGLDYTIFSKVKSVDNDMCYIEAYHLMPQDGEFVWPECPDKDMKLECWSPGYAKAMFLSRYAELTGVELCSLTR
jgi:hypothetical protein